MTDEKDDLQKRPTKRQSVHQMQQYASETEGMATRRNTQNTEFEELTRGEVAAVRIRDRLESHESTCDQFRKIVYIGLGFLITVILAMAGHIMVITGRQEVILSRLAADSGRMDAITQASATREQFMQESINKLREQFQYHERDQFQQRQGR